MLSSLLRKASRRRLSQSSTARSSNRTGCQLKRPWGVLSSLSYRTVKQQISCRFSKSSNTVEATVWFHRLHAPTTASSKSWVCWRCRSARKPKERIPTPTTQPQRSTTWRADRMSPAVRASPDSLRVDSSEKQKPTRSSTQCTVWWNVENKHRRSWRRRRNRLSRHLHFGH